MAVKLAFALLTLLACTDLGPDRARIQSMQAWFCEGDSLPCRPGDPLVRPEVGRLFGVLARAPGALLIKQDIVWPEGEYGWTDKADSIFAVYSLNEEVPWLRWRVTLPWVGDRVLDADSLSWTWP